MGFASAYGLFVVELVSVVGVVCLGGIVLIGVVRRGGTATEGLEVKHLNHEFEEDADAVRQIIHSQGLFKKLLKHRTKERKHDKKADKKRLKAADDSAVNERDFKRGDRPRVFVLDFKGDIHATATDALRREVNAVLAVAAEDDQVLVRLENAGGTVHEHGLAASQLARIKDRGITLIVAVDKVAASGGYLMATVADRILAAPFAIIGSIGVLTQLPNFHRLLEKSGVDYEQITAGRYKRTLTLFGENTDEGREKTREEIEAVHSLFKEQIVGFRDAVDIEAVATGEHWYGSKALQLKLVDELGTSDDFLLKASANRDLYSVTCKRHRRLQDRLFGAVEGLLARFG